MEDANKGIQALGRRKKVNNLHQVQTWNVSQILTNTNNKIQQTSASIKKMRKANAVFRTQRWRMRVKLRSIQETSRLTTISETNLEDNRNIEDDNVEKNQEIVTGNQNEHVEENRNENVGENPDGNQDENLGENPDRNLSENLDGNQDENLEENLDEILGENPDRNLSENQDGNMKENQSKDLGGNQDENLGKRQENIDENQNEHLRENQDENITENPESLQTSTPIKTPFQSRSTEWRSTKKAKAALPKTPRRKSRIVEKLINSPSVRPHLEEKGLILSKTIRRQLQLE